MSKDFIKIKEQRTNKTRKDLILMFAKETGNSKQADIMLREREGLITSDYAKWLEEKLIENLKDE